MNKWLPQIGKRVYVADPTRYPTGIVRVVTDTTVTLDTGTHEGLMPRYIDIPIGDIRRTARDIYQ